MSRANSIYTSTFVTITLLLVLTGITKPAISQNSSSLSFSTIDNTNGLPDNYINKIVTDSLGFLWIATNNGLCRYDSPYNIKIYKTGELGLESSIIRSLYVAHDNTIWIGTRYGGLTKVSPTRDRTHTYKTAGLEGMALSNDEILSICEVNEKEIWLGTENGLNILDPATDSIFYFDINLEDEFSLQTKAILDIYEDNEGRIWLATWDGSLYLYLESESKKISEGTFRKFTISTHRGSKNIWRIYQDSQHRFWIATHGGGLYLMQLPPEANNDINRQDWQAIFHQFLNDSANPSSISSDHILDVQEDLNGNIWIASVHGLNIIDHNYLQNISGDDYTYDLIDIEFNRQFYNPENKGSLCNNNVTEIYRDKQNQMWVSTISGVNQYNWYTNQFDLHTINNRSKQGNNEFEFINHIYIKNDSTAILASDLNGVIKYDLKRGSIIKSPSYEVKELHQRLTYIYPAENNLLYIGTKNGIAVLDEKTNKSRLFPINEDNQSTVQNINITCIYKDSQNRLWGGTGLGLFMLNESTGEYSFFKSDDRDANSIPDNSITHIYEDSHANMWVSTFNGLCKLKEGEKIIFESFKRGDPDIENNIPSNLITSISEFNNKVYFGTHNGIFYYDLDLRTFSILNTSNKIYSIQSLEITRDGILWAGTFDGILRFDIYKNDIKLYTKNDGIGDMSFRNNSSYLYNSNDLYFGGGKGILNINSSSIIRNPKPPDIYITDIEILNSEKSISYNGTSLEEIVLEPNNVYLSINYAALNYNQAEYNQYAYRLEGFKDDEWKYVGSKQQATYTNLDPGNYTFSVKATNNEGIWNEEGKTIQIKIKASLIETLWFKILSFICTAGLIYILISRYTHTQNIKKRNQFLSSYNQKLNNQIEITKKTQAGLLDREQSMKILVQKLEESNQELLRSNKDLKQFAYIASHDMKEPLRTVGTFTHLINHKYKDLLDSSGKEYLNFITDGVDRMNDLINSLLTYSQVGKKEIQFSHSDITELVQLKLKDLSSLIQKRNVSIELGELPSIFCEKDQIGMVFYNLILNGIKFNASERPSITVDYKEKPDEYIFSVKDNGIGIEEKHQEQIFEVFTRLHRREIYEGTGIGLALCNKIIHRHNGKIWLDSTLGKGSTFYFTISKNIHPTDKKIKRLESTKTAKDVRKIIES